MDGTPYTPNYDFFAASKTSLLGFRFFDDEWPPKFLKIPLFNRRF